MSKKPNFEDANKLEAIDFEIHRHLEKLDNVARDYEARWGIGNLESYATHGLSEKWEDQKDKLRQAVYARNLNGVIELVNGTIRGWGALESSAIAEGYKPIDPDAWECKLESGFHIRITKNLSDAKAAHKPGARTFTLEEVALLLESRFSAVYDVKAAIPEAEVKGVSFDFDEGDKCPF